MSVLWLQSCRRRRNNPPHPRQAMGGIIHQQQILAHHDEDLSYMFLDQHRQELVNLVAEHRSAHGYIFLFFCYVVAFYIIILLKSIGQWLV